MAFDYFGELFKSIKMLWHNQVVFWESILYFVIAVVPYVFVTILAGLGTVSVWSLWYFWILYILMILFMYYVMAGVYRTLYKINKGEKQQFGAVIKSGKEIIGSFILFVILALIIMSPGLAFYIYGFSQLGNAENFTQIAAFMGYFLTYIIYALLVGYFLFFGMAAVATGKPAWKSIKESFRIATKGTHTIKTYLTLLLATLLFMIAYSIVMGIGILLSFVLIGIPIVIAAYFGIFFFSFAMALYIIRSYLNALKASK